MRLLRQFESLKIDDFWEEVYSYPDHSHLYYEIVFIHEGHGQHFINDSSIFYEPGDLFLLSPGDHHYFEISRHTHFTFIKFTQSYFVRESLATDAQSPLSVMHLKSVKESKLIFSEPYRSIIRNIIENIVSYNGAQNMVDLSGLVYYQLYSLLELIVEQTAGNKDLKTDYHIGHRVLQYIYQHIYSREKISIAALSVEFSFAGSYFSNWFKRNYNISFREYVTQHRNILLEKRMNTTSLSLKEIAAEFDFVDESHLIKYFIRHFGCRPSEYRSCSGGQTINLAKGTKPSAGE